MLLVIVGLWLVSPVFYASQIEAFSANISSLALRFGPQAPHTVFPSVPALGDYLYDTRIGVILILRVIGQMTGHYGGGAFHALMLISFVTFVLSSAAIARRFAGTGMAIATASVLVLPGAVNTSFAFNDDIPSAAFATLGLALVSWRQSLTTYAAAGALLGFAVMCRLDALFVAPMIAGVCWIELRRLRPILARAAVSVASASVVVALVYVVSGVSPLDALHIGPRFLIYLGQNYMLKAQIWLLDDLLGLPGAILLLLGVAIGSTRRPDRSDALLWMLVFVAYPLYATGAFAFRTSLEVRHFYPLLVPFIAIHVAVALDTLREWIATRVWRTLAIAILGVCAVVMAVPPGASAWVVKPARYFALRDGPRTALFGRLWMPLLWFRWQYAQRDSVASAKALVAQASEVPNTLILTSHYNDQAFVRLSLLEAGYSIGAAADFYPDCRQSAVTLYRKAGHSVFLVQADNHYLKMPLSSQQAVAFFVTLSRSCTEAWNSDKAFLTMMGRPDRLRAFTTAGLSGIFAPIADRIGAPVALNATMAPAQVPLLANPFAILPATTETPDKQYVRIFHSLELQADELKAIADEAAVVSQDLSYGYQDFRETYASSEQPGGPAG